MDGAALREKARGNEVIYGTMWGHWAHTYIAQVAGSGLDFIIMDNEHTPADRSTTRAAIKVIANAGIAPLVRIPSLDLPAISQALDAGAHGVVVPYCEDPDQIRRCVAAARWRPLKGARFEQAIREGGPRSAETRAYLENYNRNAFFIAMIESAPAVEQLDEILDIEGIDAVFIGPHDLTVSYDLAEQYEHPTIQAAIAEIIGKCKARGIPAGTHWWTPELVLRELALGGRLAVYYHDEGMIGTGYHRDLAEFRRVMASGASA